MTVKQMMTKKAVNKQFEMIGETLKFEDIEKGYILVKDKEVAWYTLHYFRDEAQYNEWRDWMKKEGYTDKLMDEIDLAYGMVYKYQKQKGQLDLF